MYVHLELFSIDESAVDRRVNRVCQKLSGKSNLKSH